MDKLKFSDIVINDDISVILQKRKNSKFRFFEKIFVYIDFVKIESVVTLRNISLVKLMRNVKSAERN